MIEIAFKSGPVLAGRGFELQSLTVVEGRIPIERIFAGIVSVIIVTAKIPEVIPAVSKSVVAYVTGTA